MAIPTASDLVREVREDGGPKTYDKWAGQYDQLLNDEWNYVGYKSVVSKFQEYYGGVVKAGVKQMVLDAGCGTGLLGQHITSIFSRDEVEVYGGDFSPGMLKEAENKNAYVDLKVINMKTELPYESEKFDCILSSGVFSKSHCHADCLPNLYRILKSGGHVIITVKRDLQALTKQEWDKYTKEYNCDILEVTGMPYHDESDCLVYVIRKN